MKKYTIIKRSIILNFIPKEYIKEGIVIKMKNKKSVFNNCKGDIIDSCVKYPLPQHIKIKNINKILIKLLK